MTVTDGGSATYVLSFLTCDQDFLNPTGQGYSDKCVRLVSLYLLGGFPTHQNFHQVLGSEETLSSVRCLGGCLYFEICET